VLRKCNRKKRLRLRHLVSTMNSIHELMTMCLFKDLL
jgi:hypothetical protein